MGLQNPTPFFSVRRFSSPRAAVRRLGAAAFCLLFACLPLAHWNGLFDPYAAQWGVGLLLSGLACLLGVWVRVPAPEPGDVRRLLPVILWCAWQVVCVAVSPYPLAGVTRALTTASGLFVFSAGLLWWPRLGVRALVEFLAAGILALCAVLACEGACGLHWTGGLGNKNIAASFLLASLFPVAAWWLGSGRDGVPPGRLPRIVPLASLVTGSIAFGVMESRAAGAVMVLALPVFAAVALWVRGKRAWGWTVAGLLSAGIALAGPLGPRAIFPGDVRWLIWEGVFRMGRAAPWTGFGPGAYPAVAPRFMPWDFFIHPGAGDIVDNAHSFAGEMLAESGWIGLLLWIAVLAGAGVGLFRHLKNARTPAGRLAVAGVGAGLAALLLHNLVDASLNQSAALQLLMWAFLGLGYAAPSGNGCGEPDRQGGPGVQPGRGPLVLAILLVWVPLMYWDGVKPVAGQWLMKQGLVLRYSGRATDALEAMNRAIGWVSGEPVFYYRKAFLLASGDALEESARAYLQTAELNPDYGHVRRNLGVVCARLQAWPDAVEHLDRALRNNPYDAEARRWMLKICRLQDPAREKLERARWRIFQGTRGPE